MLTRRSLFGGLPALLGGCALVGERFRPITGAHSINVFVDRFTPLGEELRSIYGSNRVDWCGGGPAEWCSLQLAKTLTEPAAIASFASFVNERLDGWRKPFLIDRSLDVQVQFLGSAGDVVGTIGAYPGRLCRPGAEGLHTRKATRLEMRRFLRLGHLAENQVGF